MDAHLIPPGEITTSELPEDVLDKLIPLLYDGVFSIRELILLGHYIDPKNPGPGKGLRSATLAGYGGTAASLAVQASRTLKKAKEMDY